MNYVIYFSAISKAVEGYVLAGGYPLLFLVVFLEGMPLIGTIVPGHVAIIASGFLIKIGIFNPWLVVVISLVAALSGDYTGYLLGRKYGLGLIDRLRPYFFLSDAQLSKAQDLLDKHTGKAMIIGRLSPVTRALMPFLVGTGRTKHGRFWLFNLIGGSLWVIGSIFLGYAFGAGYSAISGYFGKVVLVGIILATVILWGYRFVNIRFHIFKKYELFVLGLNLLSIWGMSEMVEDIWSIPPFFANLDLAVNSFMADLTGHVMPYTAVIAGWVSAVGSPTVISSVAIISTIWFIYRGKIRSGVIFLLSISSAEIINGFMKVSPLFAINRPTNALQVLTDHSFPSDHATAAASFFIVLAYLLAPKMRSLVFRESFIVVCVFAAGIVGLSRLVLNVHWLSDIIAGWSLGVFCATASILLVKYVGTFFIRKNIPSL